MKSSSGLKELKDFVDAVTGKKEIDTFKTLFSKDDNLHFNNKRKEYDFSLDEFDLAEEFAEEYEDDFDSFEEAMEYYEDEKDED